MKVLYNLLYIYIYEILYEYMNMNVQLDMLSKITFSWTKEFDHKFYIHANKAPCEKSKTVAIEEIRNAVVACCCALQKKNLLYIF